MSAQVTSFQQRRLDWLAAAERLGWTGPVNLVHRAYLATGLLAVDALARACVATAARHHALGASFTAHPDGTWKVTTVDQPPTPAAVLRVGLPAGASASSEPADVAAALIAHHRPFTPAATPRFRVHLAPLATHRAVILVAADRLVTDDQSLAILTRTLTDAYQAAIRHDHTTPAPTPLRPIPTIGQPPHRPLPPAWAKLADQMTAHGAHASVDLPVRLPFDQHPDRRDVGTITIELAPSGSDDRVAIRAGTRLFIAALAAIAQPLTTRTSQPVWLYLYPDLRQPHQRDTIGAYTARTLIRIPPHRPLPGDDTLRVVQQAYEEACGPGVAWTEQLHDHAGADHIPPRHPSIAVTTAPPPAPLHLTDVQTTPLPAPTLDLGPGRIVYELHDTTLCIHHEHGRYPDGLLTALGHETACAWGSLAGVR